MEDKQESLYLSRKEKPLGVSRDNSAFMPESIDRLTTAFGKPNRYGKVASDLVLCRCAALEF